VALADLTESAVLQAIGEFDDLGRDPFLQKYGFGRSRGYFLIHGGKSYDSKAIAGAAHGNIQGNSQPLLASDLAAATRR
jgi:hypothetical protein